MKGPINPEAVKRALNPKRYPGPLPSLKGDCILHTRPSRVKTRQLPESETNINLIVARYLKTGQLPNAATGSPVFGDRFSMPHNLQQVLQGRADVKQLMAALPKQVRDEVGDDPRRFETWLSDERNLKLAVKLGLLVERKPAPAPTPPSAPTPPAPAPKGGSAPATS